MRLRRIRSGRIAMDRSQGRRRPGRRGTLLIVEPDNGEVVADHALAAPGGAIIADDHYGEPRPAPNRGPRPKTAEEKRFCELGRLPSSSSSVRPRSATPAWATELDVLLALGAAYGDESLVDAPTRALAFKRFRAPDVSSILATGAAAPNPRPPGDALIMILPSAPTRSLDAYKHIPGQ